MTHDQEADWASSEIARNFLANPSICFGTPPVSTGLSAYATHEGKNAWPHADGVVVVEDANSVPTRTFNIAIEYKRPNEGLHGILTAMGQANAYLKKGYSGSAIVIPKVYSSFSDPGNYVNDVLNLTHKTDGIGVFVYSEPDATQASPFYNKLTLIRDLKIDSLTPAGSPLIAARKAQWVHLREGSSDPDAFYRYLQAVKHVSSDYTKNTSFSAPTELLNAIQRLQPGADPLKYLSNTAADKLADKSWRHFWFSFILFDDMMIPWTQASTGIYSVNHVITKLQKSDGTGFKNMFSGRSDSIKNSLVNKLNMGTINERNAWEELAKNFRNRAHSYREDIDSGLEGIGFVELDGRLTEEGYKFVDSCERSGNANIGKPRSLLLQSLLNRGGMATFLHYIFHLSEEVFASDPLAFIVSGVSGIKLDEKAYLNYIEDKLSNEIHAMKKVSARGGVSRKPFQAELAILRGFNLVGDFRIGVGLEINWPNLQIY